MMSGQEPPIDDSPHPADAVVVPITRKMRKTPDGWRSLLMRSERGLVKSTLGNAVLVLQNDPAWKDVLGYDERESKIVFQRLPPFVADPTSFVPREVTDADEVLTVQWLEQRHGIAISDRTAHASVATVARASPFDRVREYLDDLPPWDGEPRLPCWLHYCLGAADTEYTKAVGTKWMISAVARTFDPGCKADHALVLEGEQGLGKSTALRILAGDQHFGDDIPGIGSKDAQQYLGGMWIVELGEMDAASKADQNTLKRFLTTTVDRYRASYGRNTISHPRRCVFAGTVNSDEYLKDATGGRRWWPVRCTKVDAAALHLHRDQMWAEAVHRYRAKEQWHLDETVESLAKTEQSQRTETDPWEEHVRIYLRSLAVDTVKTTDVLSECLKLEKARTTKVESNRLGGIMRRLSWRYTVRNGERCWAK